MPLLWMSLAYLAGLVLGAAPAVNPLYWLLAASSALAACLFARRLPRGLPGANGRLANAARWLASHQQFLRLPPLLLAAVFALGAWQVRSVLAGPRQGDVAAFNGQGRYQLVGVVSAPPDRREDSTYIRFAIESAAAVSANGAAGDPQPARGMIMVMVPGRVDWRYGDRFALTGSPTAPPENQEFSYRDALARKGIHSYLSYPRAQRLSTGAGSPIMAAIYSLRERAYAKLYELFPAPEAPLLAGILLGIESDLTPEWKRAFRDTGTAHIIAISGFNIALLAAVFSGFFQRVLPRWWAAGLAALAISGYTILVGAQPSVVRAAIMGSLGLLGGLLGRRMAGLAGLNTLAFTAALMCLSNPLLPRDPSFQLSFGATLGLMLYAEPLQSGFQRMAAARVGNQTARRLAGPVGEYILFTLAAQFTTLPVIAYHFERLSLSSLLTNPLVLPAQPLLMILSGLAVVAGLVFDPLGRLLAGLAWPFSAYSLRVVEAAAHLPGGSISLGTVDGTKALLLAVLALSPFAFSQAPSALRSTVFARVRSHLRPAAVLLVAALLAVLALRAAATRPDGRLHLSLFNQEGQPVALLQSPHGARLLIGGGPGGNRLTSALGRRLPLDHTLDAAMIYDCSRSSLESLPVLAERLTIRQTWWGCLPADERQARELNERLLERAVDSQRLAGGRVLDAGGAALEILPGTPKNAAVWLSAGNLRMLLPGRLSAAGLGARVHQPSLLVLGEADLYSTEPHEWEALRAQVVIAALGPDLRAGLPGRWIILRPDQWAEVVSDGAQMWIEVGP